MNHPISEQMNTDQNLRVVTEHAKAVGMLCMYWSTLEYSMGLVIEKLLEADASSSAIMLSTSRDISQKCEIARRLVHHRVRDDARNEWRHYFIGVLDVVQNILSPKRNRYVHDDWNQVEDQIIQYNRTIKLYKPEARAEKQLLFCVETASKPEEIWKLTDNVIKTFVCLTLMSENLRISSKFGLELTIPQPAIEVCKLNPQWKRLDGSEEN